MRSHCEETRSHEHEVFLPDAPQAPHRLVPHREATWKHPSLWNLGLGTVTVQPVWRVEPGRSQRTGLQPCGGGVVTGREQPCRSGTFCLSPVSYARVSSQHPSSQG